MKVTNVRSTMLCSTRWRLPGGTPYQTGISVIEESPDIKNRLFSNDLTFIQRDICLLESQVFGYQTGKIQADSWQLDTAGENPSVTEWSIWFMKKQNKWFHEVRYAQWRTPMQKIDGLICNDQPSPPLIRELGRNEDSPLGKHIDSDCSGVMVLSLKRQTMGKTQQTY